MAATYTQFLASPSSSALADNASLHYVTSTTSLRGPTDIIKHFNSLQKQVKKKKEDVINLIDGGASAVFEVDTALEFLTSGGAYLPGLDDNFLSDRVAYLPITHIVSFDEEGKIVQIRQQWDQGSLLKQLEIIGKTGRNWPIRDSREQLTLIQSCIKASGSVAAMPASRNEATIRTRGNSTNALRDPHTTLHMIGTREEMEAEPATAAVSPYAGRHRPKQRSFADILGDEPTEEPAPSSNQPRAMSPAKSGSSKNYQPARLFEGQEYEENDDTPKGKGKGKDQYIRPNPKKYSHFDFADGSDPQDQPRPGMAFEEKPKSKHDSQWSFDDFMSPAKPQATKVVRAQDVRHWGDDEDAQDDSTAQPTGKGRRDAETHFELQDDGDRDERNDRPTRPRGSTHNDGMGLYKNNVIDNEGAAAGDDRALGNITNLGHRGKDFDPHFAMTDEPAQPQAAPQHVPEARKKAVKMMDPQWSSYDESPKLQKENHMMASRPAGLSNTRINIAGDGMGGRKGTGRNWLYHDEAEEEEPQPPRPTGRRAGQPPKSADKGFWDF